MLEAEALSQESLRKVVQEVVEELIEQASLGQNDVLVIGASSSEVIGERIGTSGSMQVARALVEGILASTKPRGIFVAFQCCEHLNRALVVERTLLERERLDEVSVVPVAKAGGAVASTAYQLYQDPVLVEHIVAKAGIDIGDTLIGMHIRHVAVPVRLTRSSIGQAHLVAARSRPKLIGGQRAVYTRDGLEELC
nr:TIGR01440 family protein [Bacilli bacterium]